jgi:hypothetical protein
MSDVVLETRNDAARPTTLAQDRWAWKASPDEAVLVVEKEGELGYAVAIEGSGGGLVCSGDTTVGAQISGHTTGAVIKGKTDTGVYGETAAEERAGIFGHNSLKSGAAYGVAGRTASRDGAAVIGLNQEVDTEVWGPGTGVWGVSGSGTGVLGQSTSGDGVQGNAAAGEGHAGVLGQNDAESGVGVKGLSGRGTAVLGSGESGIWGYGQGGVGVVGSSASNHGVVGTATVNTKCGVYGINNFGMGVVGRSDSGIGVVGGSVTGIGVMGGSFANHGVVGISSGLKEGSYFAGVCGAATRSVGVFAQVTDPNASTGIALYAKAPKYAGWFEGDVLITGNVVIEQGLEVQGPKSAVVAFADGSHRLLYAIESPEAWFEDFGEAKLIKGTAHVPLDPNFARTVDASRYHVFLTPYGDSNGLYVARRTRVGFDVAERDSGKSNITFSWRVVAQPKAAKRSRFAKTAMPQSVERMRAAAAKRKWPPAVDTTVLPGPEIDPQWARAPKLPKRTTPIKLPNLPDLPKLDTRNAARRRQREMARRAKSTGRGGRSARRKSVRSTKKR